VYKELSKLPTFISFCQQVTETLNTRLNLLDFLITPIQRLPRYDLLIRELLKYTPDNHVDYHNLTKAKAEIQNMNQNLNEKQKEHENQLKLYQIQQSITTTVPLLLVSPQRLFVREGEVDYYKKDGSRSHGYIFLLSDMLLLTKKERDNNLKRLTTAGLRLISGGHTKENQPTLTLIDTIKLAHLSVKDEENQDFLLIHGDIHWKITATDNNKSLWLNSLRDSTEILSLKSIIDENIEKLK